MIYDFDYTNLALGVFPGLLVLDLLINGHRKRRHKIAFNKVRKRGLAHLKQMSWQDFERVCALHFRAQGYKVKMCGLGGADGGMDLLLRRRWKTTVVQCKHWKAKVGVPTVREMFAVMKDQGFDAVIIVGLSGFTKAARDWIGNKPILLVSGEELIQPPKA